MAKRSTAKEFPGWSDQEVEDMLVPGVVNQLLEDEHSDLLKTLYKRARKMLAPLDAQQLRAIAAAKVGDPASSLTSLIKEVTHAYP